MEKIEVLGDTDGHWFRRLWFDFQAKSFQNNVHPIFGANFQNLLPLDLFVPPCQRWCHWTVKYLSVLGCGDRSFRFCSLRTSAGFAFSLLVNETQINDPNLLSVMSWFSHEKEGAVYPTSKAWGGSAASADQDRPPGCDSFFCGHQIWTQCWAPWLTLQLRPGFALVHNLQS